MKTKDKIRELAISLLDDNEGISEESYNILYDLLKNYKFNDILSKIEAIEGRFYIQRPIGYY